MVLSKQSKACRGEIVQQPIPTAASVRGSISIITDICAFPLPLRVISAYQCESVTIDLCCHYRESNSHHAEEMRRLASFETALSESWNILLPA